MKIYNKPELEITKFEVEDIITVSSTDADIDGGSAAFPEGWQQPGGTAADLLSE